MNHIKQQLIETALQKHDKIYPCISRQSLDECFTIEGERVLFWFNTEDHSTHILSADVA